MLELHVWQLPNFLLQVGLAEQEVLDCAYADRPTPHKGCRLALLLQLSTFLSS